MIIKNIDIINFRNLKKQKIFFNRKNNLIKGKNGSGKSNILEALYLFFKGKSFRKAKFLDMINWNKSFFRLELNAEKCRYDNFFLYYDKKKS